MPICNEKNREGATALHVAASHRCSAGVIKIMVETEFVEGVSSLTLSQTNRGRTPMHYACLSFRGLGIDAFRVLLEATIEAHAALEKSANSNADVHMNDDHNEDLEWEENIEKVNAFTMQDHLGYTPLSLLFKRYRERVKYVIRSLERRTSLSSSQALASVHAELGSLWLKARLIVCLMAEKRREESSSNDILDLSEEACPREDAVAREAARWATQNHKSSSEYENEDEDEDNGGRIFRLVHASVALAGYGCPTEMIRLAMSVHPNQVREMDEDGNLPLHIAAVASSFLPDQSPTTTSDEDSLMSGLSNISGVSCDMSRPFAKVIRMLLQSYPEASQISHGTSGRLPLILAMDAGQRTMHDGMKLLLEAYPAALESKEFDPKLYPYILSTIGKAREVKVVVGKHTRFPRFGRKKKELVKKHLPTALYDCVRARPNLLVNDVVL